MRELKPRDAMFITMFNAKYDGVDLRGSGVASKKVTRKVVYNIDTLLPDYKRLNFRIAYAHVRHMHSTSGGLTYVYVGEKAGKIIKAFLREQYPNYTYAELINNYHELVGKQYAFAYNPCLRNPNLDLDFGAYRLRCKQLAEQGYDAKYVIKRLMNDEVVTRGLYNGQHFSLRIGNRMYYEVPDEAFNHKLRAF